MTKVSLPPGMALGIHDSYSWGSPQWMSLPDVRLMSDVVPPGLTVTAGNAFLTTASAAPSFNVTVNPETSAVVWKLRDMYDTLVNAGTTAASGGAATVTFPLPPTGFYRVSMKPAEKYGWVEFGLLVTAPGIAANPFSGINGHFDFGSSWGDQSTIINALALMGIGAIRQTYRNSGPQVNSGWVGALSDFQSGGFIKVLSDLMSAKGMKLNYQTWPELTTTTQSAWMTALLANISALGASRFCGISFGNEFNPYITGTQYAAFMQAVYSTLHTANPSIPLVAGQTDTHAWPGAGSWWDDFKTANGLHYCDVINWHQYGGYIYQYAQSQANNSGPYLGGATNPTTGLKIKMEIGETGNTGRKLFYPRQYMDEQLLLNWLVASGGATNFPFSTVYLYDAVMDGGQNGELLPGPAGSLTAPIGETEANFGMIAPPYYIPGVNIYTPTARGAPIATFNRFINNSACTAVLFPGATITGSTALGVQMSTDSGSTYGALLGDEVGGSFVGVGGKAVVSVNRILNFPAYDTGDPYWPSNYRWRVAKPSSGTYSCYDSWGQAVTNPATFSQDSTYLYWHQGLGASRLYMVQN